MRSFYISYGYRSSSPSMNSTIPFEPQESTFKGAAIKLLEANAQTSRVSRKGDVVLYCVPSGHTAASISV